MEGVIAVFALFGAPAIYFLSKTDLGEAVIERIRHGTAGGGDSALAGEVDDLRARLAEMEERLDFAERALTAGADARRTTHEARS